MYFWKKLFDVCEYTLHLKDITASMKANPWQYIDFSSSFVSILV